MRAFDNRLDRTSWVAHLWDCQDATLHLEPVRSPAKVICGGGRVVWNLIGVDALNRDVPHGVGS